MKIQLVSLLFMGFLAACQNKSAPKPTYTSGEVKILADESFSPIVDEQKYVFESTYGNAKLDIIYKPENEALRLFLSDSIRMAVLSRELSAEESKHFKNKNIVLRVNRFAVDGVALVTAKSGPDTAVLVSDIIALMQGKKSKIKSLVFDNPNSSTVRFLKELAAIKLLPSKGVYALKSNPEVIEYVNANPGAIGVIGINWVVQPDKPLQQAVDNLRVLGIKNLPGKPGSDGYYKPNQSDLALGLYPLTRNLYIINAEGGPGLGTGFASFLAGEQGQRIVLKSGLLPDSIPSREVIIR